MSTTSKLGALAALAALVVTSFAPLVWAEERVLEVGRWYPGVEAGIALTQSSYSDNWAGGDRGSVVWAAIFNGTLENQFKPSLNWNNALKLAFGQTHQQKAVAGERVWEKPEKSTDLIDYETILRVTRGWVVDPFVSGRFESQFIDGSDPFDRNLTLNPMQFKESAGVARKFINEEERELLSRVGFTLRQNVRRSFVEPPPVEDKETETANDGGIEWVTDYKTRVLDDNVVWTSKLTVYQPFFYSADADFDALSDSLASYGIDADAGDFAKVVDIDWENIFSTQITKHISVNLYAQWIYDKYDNSVPPLLNEDGSFKNPGSVKAAIRKAGQFKQTMSIGFTYRFL
jgi:hypothetical protein